MSSSTTLIAIIDDDEHVLKATARLLQMQEFDVLTFPTAEAFLESSHLPCVSCLVCDLRLPGMHGLALLQELRNKNRRIPSIFITAHPQDIIRRSGASDAAFVLKKPFDAGELIDCVQKVLDRKT